MMRRKRKRYHRNNQQQRFARILHRWVRTIIPFMHLMHPPSLHPLFPTFIPRMPTNIHSTVFSSTVLFFFVSSLSHLFLHTHSHAHSTPFHHRIGPIRLVCSLHPRRTSSCTMDGQSTKHKRTMYVSLSIPSHSLITVIHSRCVVTLSPYKALNTRELCTLPLLCLLYVASPYFTDYTLITLKHRL